MLNVLKSRFAFNFVIMTHTSGARSMGVIIGPANITLSNISRILMLFCIVALARPTNAFELSNRIVTTKYGALRGHVLSISPSQHVEVFLGKLFLQVLRECD